MSAKSTSKARVPAVDAFRGFAVVLMIIFHFCYDLRYFGWVDWDVPNGEGWWQFRYVILTLFIGTLGISLRLAHGQDIHWRSFWVRILKLATAGILIVIMSLVMFPQSWIFFGILQFLLFASLVCIWLVSRSVAALTLAIVLFGLYFSGVVDSFWPFAHVAHLLPVHTEDYVPVFPWLSVAFIGVFVGSLIESNAIKFLQVSAPYPLVWLGQNALIVYLLHQPLLFAILTPISWLFPLI